MVDAEETVIPTGVSYKALRKFAKAVGPTVITLLGMFTGGIWMVATTVHEIRDAGKQSIARDVKQDAKDMALTAKNKLQDGVIGVHETRLDAVEVSVAGLKAGSDG